MTSSVTCEWISMFLNESASHAAYITTNSLDGRTMYCHLKSECTILHTTFMTSWATSEPRRPLQQFLKVHSAVWCCVNTQSHERRSSITTDTRLHTCLTLLVSLQLTVFIIKGSRYSTCTTYKIAETRLPVHWQQASGRSSQAEGPKAKSRREIVPSLLIVTCEPQRPLCWTYMAFE